MKADNGFNLGKVIRQSIREDLDRQLEKDIEDCMVKYFEYYNPVNFFDEDNEIVDLVDSTIGFPDQYTQ